MDELLDFLIEDPPRIIGNLPCCSFFDGEVSLYLNFPRLFIFNVAKHTPIRIKAEILAENHTKRVAVSISSIHFTRTWETSLGEIEQACQTWYIERPPVCKLIPYNLTITITIDGYAQTLFDGYANTISKTKQFPNGLAYMLIQEMNGKKVDEKTFDNLHKKESVRGIDIPLPDKWLRQDQEEILQRIWESLDIKNLNRKLEFKNSSIISSNSRFIRKEQSNKLKQYIVIWNWIFNVLKFYSDHYDQLGGSFGLVPEWIDRDQAEARLNMKNANALIVRFGSNPNQIICSTMENGRCEHFAFLTSLPKRNQTTDMKGTKGLLSDLSDFLEYKSKTLKYLQSDMELRDLENIIQEFSVFQNFGNGSSNTSNSVTSPNIPEFPKLSILNTIQRDDSGAAASVQFNYQIPNTNLVQQPFVDHCNLLSTYINEMRILARSNISLDELERSLHTLRNSFADSSNTSTSNNTNRTYNSTGNSAQHTPIHLQSATLPFTDHKPIASENPFASNSSMSFASFSQFPQFNSSIPFTFDSPPSHPTTQHNHHSRSTPVVFSSLKRLIDSTGPSSLDFQSMTGKRHDHSDMPNSCKKIKKVR